MGKGKSARREKEKGRGRRGRGGRACRGHAARRHTNVVGGGGSGGCGRDEQNAHLIVAPGAVELTVCGVLGAARDSAMIGCVWVHVAGDAPSGGLEM